MIDLKTKSKAENLLMQSSLKQYFTEVYKVVAFTLRFFKEIFLPPYEFKEIVRQCYYIGYKSVALISLTGFITGIVFTKQSRPSLSEFGASSWLPSLVGIAIVRALAPLITALIAAGKVGSNIGAELGSMKVTEQIDAMEVSGTKPFKFLVCTRIAATTIMMPALVMYTGFVGMIGAFLNVHHNEMTSIKTFFQDA
ncbi:MAG TPA: ABC transporter permease, partial [Panacibacter sp.]|nr:ABC transporter permease [Panacibacter sp.]